MTGVDFSEVGIEKARRLADARKVEVEWLVADLLQFQIPSGAFELVILFYLQMPAEERQRIVRTAAEAVAFGGTFLLVAHDSRNLEHGYGGPKDAAVLYSSGDVVSDLNGLEIERAELVERPVETPEGERVALDALVRARRATVSPTR